MACTPKQMGEAIVRNLKAKTGKDLSEWLKLVRKTNLEGKKPIINYLKSEFGLGHFQAQKVFEAHIGYKAYQDSENYPKKLFKANTDFEHYQAIASKITSLGSDVNIQPCHTYIPFYRKKQFAILQPHQEGILLGINAPKGFNHSRFQKGKTGASERINHFIILKSPESLTKDLLAILQSAYENN